MELWIRSQNKEKMVKVNELSLYDSNILENDFVLNDEPKYSDIKIIANDKYNLGSYKTKERALEILDEIQKRLNPMLVFNKCEWDEETLKQIKEIGYCFVNDDKSRIEQLSAYVYEMPKE